MDKWRTIVRVAHELPAKRRAPLRRRYGRYGWQGLVKTVQFFDADGHDVPRIGVRRGGWIGTSTARATPSRSTAPRALGTKLPSVTNLIRFPRAVAENVAACPRHTEAVERQS